MRTIEIRRHCFTKKGEARGKGSHLSAEGVAQARYIGSSLGSFDLVLTSFIPRTLETAIAMGFAVDAQIEALGDISSEVWDEIGHQERWMWERPFEEFHQIIQRGGPTAKMGQVQRQVWTDALEAVPENGNVLMISHGRVIESGLVTCIPHGDFAHWGNPFHHGEGICLQYENGQFRNLQFRRLVSEITSLDK